MACSHLSYANVTQNLQGKIIHKDECTKCFINSKSEHGIDICLRCFNGSCSDLHSHQHYLAQHHPLVVRLQMVKRPRVSEEPQQISKLAIGVPGGAGYSADEYDPHTTLMCLACNVHLQPTSEIYSLINSILMANSALFQSSVDAWELELQPCEHTLLLEQLPRQLAEKSLASCNSCELKANLWLCMVCGNLGCGRKNYDGSGGNGHALEHFQTTGHGVVCKIGTITPEGTASIHCYTCDNEVLDPNLADHLKTFGILIQKQVKTEKTITEMELESNINLTLSKAVEEGRTLSPRYGPGYTGMENLGNSCYLNSVMQLIFSFPEWQRRYTDEDHLNQCRSNDPSQCYFCQMNKLGIGLWCGENSLQKWTEPVNTVTGEVIQPTEYQDGIRPQMFKSLVGKGHPEFSSARQQDAYEFFSHFLSFGQKAEKAAGMISDYPGKIFEFKLATKMKCLKCHGVKYNSANSTVISVSVPIDLKEDGPNVVVDFDKVLNTFTQPEIVEYNCPNCKQTTNFSKQFMFETYPKVLVIVVNRFVCPDWVPKKLECGVNVPVEPFSLENMRLVKGNEQELPGSAEDSGPKFDQGLLNELLMFGFGENIAKRALIATSNKSLEEATNWIVENLENPEANLPLSSAKNEGPQISQELIENLTAMGFSASQAKNALKNCDCDPERAVDYLFSHPDEDMEVEQPQIPEEVGDNGPANYQLQGVVTHLGASVHSGHYVAHIMKEGECILYNDIKVAASSDPPLGKGYLYFFRKLN